MRVKRPLASEPATSHAGHVRCRRHGCGDLLRPVVDSLGRADLICDSCARNKRGRCRDCPAKLPNVRCVRCRACQRRHAAQRRLVRDRAKYADPDFRAKKLAKQREYMQRPEVKAKYREMKRRWRERNPGYHSWATMKTLRTNPKSRKRHNERQRAYYRRHRDAHLAYQREYYQRTKAERLRYQKEYRARKRAERQAARSAAA